MKRYIFGFLGVLSILAIVTGCAGSKVSENEQPVLVEQPKDSLTDDIVATIEFVKKHEKPEGRALACVVYSNRLLTVLIQGNFSVEEAVHFVMDWHGVCEPWISELIKRKRMA